MANYRQVHVSIWKDEWFLELTPTEKLLFVYLFSNESASLSGIYKIALRVISFETCLPMKKVTDALRKFADMDKVYYQDGVVWVKNLRKYNRGSSKVATRIQKDLEEIPYCELKEKYIAYYDPDIPYGYPMDTLSTEMKTNEIKTNEENTIDIVNLFEIYEENIGALTPMIAEQIKDWEEHYANSWVAEAVEIAVKNEIRKASYISGILKNWHTEGKGKKGVVPKSIANIPAVEW